MATLIEGNILLGSSPADAAVDRIAFDVATPWVGWTLQPGITQARFSIRISSVEPGRTAYTTSGPRTSVERGFQFPFGIQLNQNFEGLCTIEVAISSATSGDFEYVLPTRYAVYDRSIERLFASDAVMFRWTRASNPDGLPVPAETLYHLQVSTDPLFEDVDYEDAAIVDAATAIIEHVADDFDPEEGAAYFFRVRQSDGLDWGDWSYVGAFLNLSGLPPAITITAVTPLLNDHGDIWVDILVTDSDSSHISVVLAWQGSDGKRHVAQLVESSAYMPPGSMRFTWRTRPKLGLGVTAGVVLFAGAFDGESISTEAFYGPITIDNTHIAGDDPGLGMTEMSFPVHAGHMLTYPEPTPTEGQVPVAGELRMMLQSAGDQIAQTPVHIPASPRASHLSIAPFETRSGGGGFGHAAGSDRDNQTTGDVVVDALIRRVEGGQFAIWSDLAETYAMPVWSHPLTYNTHATTTGMMFGSPLDFADHADAQPRPHNSRTLATRPYLHGWHDESGEHAYPDGYDWDSRPSFHADHEVWRYDDAWIEMAIEHKTAWHTCADCHGRSWVASDAGPPYTRLPCPNPSCVDGFDHDRPLMNNGGGLVVPYLRPIWVRLSHVLNSRAFVDHDRNGLPIRPPISAIMWQHIVGRHLTSRHAAYSGATPPAVTAWKIDTPQGVRTLPPSTAAAWDIEPWGKDENGQDTPLSASIPPNGALSRQPDNGVNVSGWIHRTPAIIENAARLELPAAGGMVASTVADNGPGLPVAAHMGPGRSTYFMGTDPDSHPGMALRPTPTQVGVPRVRGRIGRVREARPLTFRFLQPWWDAYNTLHWQATGSATAKFHLQWSDITLAPPLVWSDVRGDNATHDSVTGLYLVDPLVFHAYWNTANRTLFVNGRSYRLRLRMYDPVGRRFSDWVYSPQFRIISGVTNPASVIATSYEPWSKWVEITYRLDDTEQDLYNISRVWFSSDDGVTWGEIGRGHLGGPTQGLSSVPGQNIHTLTWQASGYNLAAGDDYRIRIETIPTALTMDMVAPYFRWYTPPNPVGEEAEYQIVSILGHVDHTEIDDNGDLVPLDEPVYRPGYLEMNRQEEAQVRTHATDDAPSGYYSFVGPSGEMLDSEGYAQWLTASYRHPETHGAALMRLAARNQLLLITLRQSHVNLRASEVYVRKNLINQGYYAESHFKEVEGEIEEVVDISILSQFTGEDGDTEDQPAVYVDVPRYWRFRVQTRAEGPAGVVDEDGQYAPIDITDFERVYYKWQLDTDTSFQSQPYGRPLRSVLFNHLGDRLQMAGSQGTSPIVSSSPTIDTAREIEGEWTTGASSSLATEQFGGDSLARSTNLATVGGVYKMPPTLLPGEIESDQLPAGREQWQGGMKWRVAAYNAFHAPVTAHARPMITSMQTIVESQVAVVDFTLQSHDQITQASMAHWWTSAGAIRTTGYQVSQAYLETPIWTGVEAVNFVSDRRAAIGSATRSVNPVPWIPTGTNRPHPSVVFSSSLMQYVMVTAKQDYNNRWSLVTSRAMTLPTACEYDVLFENMTVAAMYGPSLTSQDGTLYLYMTVHTTSLAAPKIYRSTSTDGDVWTTPTPITGVSVGAHPSAQYHNGLWHLWYEALDVVDGCVKVYYATSENGVSFAIQNAGAAVISRVADDVGSPSVVRWNDAWIAYYNDGDTITSQYSTDGVSWSGLTIEMAEATIDIDGVPTLATPQHAFAFVDHYRGHTELWLAFNYVAAGVSHVFRARLEDRVWQAGSDVGMYGAAGQMVGATSSLDGDAHKVGISLLHNGISSPANLKVRLDFSIVSPTHVEYHRQSEWVTEANQSAMQSVIEPTPWAYSEQLKRYPYMELAT
jgi:hypothetical protein